ncbi:RNA-binding protein [archaeon]|nr:MAG: RNA-binding protein [archaeon]RLG65097.1 MAG: RNA-binding protein [archaeon]HDM24001.1 RNA-binding protein [Candidatus Bathyarchaeota archaeon]
MPINVVQSILEKSIYKYVLVKLKGNRKIRGKLLGYDQHVNIILDDAEEIREDDSTEYLGKIILRGDTIVMITSCDQE